MAGVENIGTNVTNATDRNTSAQSKAIGKDEFFKLLVAQLKNQDPLNPQDGAAFSAQLAQFASLEQLTNLNTEIALQNQNIVNMLNAQSINLIGKEVTARQSDATLDSTITGPVSTIQFKDGSIYLNVGGQEVAFTDVTSVK